MKKVEMKKVAAVKEQTDQKLRLLLRV
jgi:hypothetical protein